MPITRLAVVVFGVAGFGCQHIDDVEIDDEFVITMPASTEESQRINIDAVPAQAETSPGVPRGHLLASPLAGVGPVKVTSLADPQFPMPREFRVAREDAPPPEPPRPRTEAERWFYELSAVQRTDVRAICVESRRDPCFGMMPMAHGSPRQTKIIAMFARLPEHAAFTAHQFCRERDPSIICDTPLVVAFENEAIQFEAGTQTFAFQPGVPVSTDWPTATTPWIALDRDGDGAITSGAELFGDATEIEGGKATNGFIALAALDANGDGLIDRRDPAFAKLLLWADRDRDRKSSAAELTPLADVVLSIPLANQVDARCIAGNCEGERGAMIWRDPSGRVRSGAVIDVYLRRR